MNRLIPLSFLRKLPYAFCAVALAFPSFGAESKNKNPTSKVYFSDVSGEAQIDTGQNIEDLAKRSVYNAEGSVIETKHAESEADRSRYYSTMVYSNGTGAFFDADTRVEVKKFMQEPFTPNRTDADVEPSISQTQAFVSRGAVGLCTSKLVAGSNMTYSTLHASVNVRGRKLVIETNNDLTKISMLEGESTVKSGPNDMGGHIVHTGEQAIIRKGQPGQPNEIQITPIPESENDALDERVSMACQAKKTVYFDVRDRSTNGEGASAFEGADGAGREIVPVETIPANLPTQYTVSPARISGGE